MKVRPTEHLLSSSLRGANDPCAGRTRYERLLLIGTTCVPLCIEALRLAVIEAKTGRDVNRYLDAQRTLQIVAPGDPNAVIDEAWVETTGKQVQIETQRLEAELKGYKNNLIKESIRVSILCVQPLEAGLELTLATDGQRRSRKALQQYR